MKALLLARVSRKEQEDGYSLDAQKDRMQEYCRRRGLEILKVFEIVESSTVGERKQFMGMIEFAKAQPGTVAIVADAVDRVQRSFKESVLLADLVKQEKIELHFFREGKVIGKNASAMDLMSWDFAVMGARSYVLQLTENVKRSQDHMLKGGTWLSMAPLGYMNIRHDGGKADIIVDTARAPVIIKLFELYGTGNYSIEALAAHARQLGLRNKVRNSEVKKSQIHKMLQNPFYYGQMLVSGKLYDHRYPPLITKELFDRCSAVRLGYPAKPVRYCQNDQAIMRGLLRCGTSGRVVTPDPRTKHYPRTGRTVTYQYLIVARPDNPARKMYVDETGVVTQLKEALRGIQMPAEVYDELKDRLRETKEAQNRYHQEMLKELQEEELEIQRKLDRAMDLLLGDKITVEEHDRKRRMLKERQFEIREKVDTHHQADDKFRQMLSNLLSLAFRANELFERCDPQEKRMLIGLMFSNLFLHGARLEYTLRKPFNRMVGLTDRQEWSTLVDDLRTHRGWYSDIATLPVYQHFSERLAA